MSTVKLAELGEFLASEGFGNEIDGDPDITVSAVNTLELAQPGELTFLTNPKYTKVLPHTKASAVIVSRLEQTPDGLTAVRCDDPYAALGTAIVHIHGYRKHPKWGIDPGAAIAPTARIGEGANIGGNVTVREHVTIGKNATLYPGCYIADNVTIGDDVILYPNVVIYDRTQIGNRVTIHAGSVIGEDGLGYASRNGKWLKLPQIGFAIIEDEVEIGACCTIDRATVGTTRIGRGTKLSNSVVVGHGSQIGEDCMIVAQVGLAGSTKLGRNVILAGQVGVGDHVTIGDNVKVAGKSAVYSDKASDTEYMGVPAIEFNAFRRQIALVHQLPKLKKRLRDLETETADLRRCIESNGNDRS
ncbi:MAG: UDP-3-O-(3-hydroxymyristoyl)glucosamine N-acyltransferase [Planctomycetes bacterium]|nr:UDP-3-O-(3-hydroxymyristoyl)glucosamine N-acyltransferase [Planctomycetota bacterium]